MDSAGEQGTPTQSLTPNRSQFKTRHEDTNAANDPGEDTPLLGNKSAKTPLPWKSIAILMVVRLSEPVASTVRFDYNPAGRCGATVAHPSFTLSRAFSTTGHFSIRERARVER